MSVLQPLNSPRLAARVLPWSTVQIDPAALDPGDMLLDWRAGGQGLRYVHHFTEAELKDLGEAGGFQVIDGFYSDGENDRLGLYQVWQRPA
ncbi:MAG TPA: hypothetical protein VHO48_12855 [Anaerolineaceae bacterium]|nr:hypothetical protein [Anaerolineaceae bacterium]